MEPGPGGPTEAAIAGRPVSDLRWGASRAHRVSRRALIDRSRASSCSVVGVTAAAGYGKTTLLAEWAATEDRPVTWVGLDRRDDDPAVLLATIAAARAPADGADAGDGPAPSLDEQCGRLEEALGSRTAPFVLILDDVHDVRSEAGHDVLLRVLSAIPEGSQAVVASRHAQPHLARLRVEDRLWEITEDDLALPAAAVTEVFAHESVALDPDEAAHVATRTEGWAAGVHLAALRARRSPESRGSVAGNDPYIAEYLHSAVLAHLDEDLQCFLRRSAVLDRLDGDLCDAVLERTDSLARLRRLEDAGQLVVRIDRARPCFRYRRLYREFLLGELQRQEPEIAVRLHLRAAGWFEAHGEPELAVDHLIEARQFVRAAELVARICGDLYQAGRTPTLQRWLTALGDDLVEADPTLAITQAWLAAMSGRPTVAFAWAERVEAEAPMLAPLAALRSTMRPERSDRALQQARLAVALCEPWSPWASQGLAVLGEAWLLRGDEGRASELLAEAVAKAEELGHADVLARCLSLLAWQAMDRGDWAEARDQVIQAQRTSHEHDVPDHAASVLTHAAASRCHLHHGEAPAGDRLLARAMRVRGTATYAVPALAVRGRWWLAVLHWARGDADSTRVLLAEIHDVMRHRPSLGVLADQVRGFEEQVDHAVTRRSGWGPTTLTPAELRVLPYLRTHLTVAEIGEQLFVSRNTANSHIASIYRKLGASSRAGAVDAATAAGLLPA